MSRSTRSKNISSIADSYILYSIRSLTQLPPCVSSASLTSVLNHSLVAQGEPNYKYIHGRKEKPIKNFPTTKSCQISFISFTTIRFDRDRQYWKCFILGKWIIENIFDNIFKPETFVMNLCTKHIHVAVLTT